VTTHAGTWSTLENTLKVAVLAGQIPVEAAQFVPRGQVVELGPLDGGCVRYQEREQDEYESRGQRGSPRRKFEF
jgi:hypothetical protein